jgi:hypothetical protein
MMKQTGFLKINNEMAKQEGGEERADHPALVRNGIAAASSD